jgi:hypothetical protein
MYCYMYVAVPAKTSALSSDDRSAAQRTQQGSGGVAAGNMGTGATSHLQRSHVLLCTLPRYRLLEDNA